MSGGYEFHIDPDKAEELKRRAEASKRRWKEREVERFWQAVLSTEVGRSEIWRILNDWNAFRTEFRFAPAGMTDEAATWFWHGRQTGAFELFQQLMVVARDGTIAMMDQCDPRYAKEPIDPPTAEESA